MKICVDMLENVCYTTATWFRRRPALEELKDIAASHPLQCGTQRVRSRGGEAANGSERRWPSCRKEVRLVAKKKAAKKKK